MTQQDNKRGQNQRAEPRQQPQQRDRATGKPAGKQDKPGQGYQSGSPKRSVEDQASRH